MGEMMVRERKWWRNQHHGVSTTTNRVLWATAKELWVLTLEEYFVRSGGKEPIAMLKLCMTFVISDDRSLSAILSILKRSEKIMFGEAWSQIKDGENNLADAEHRRWMFSISVDEESQANDTQEGNPKTDGVLVSSSRQYFLSRSQYRSLHQKQPFNIWHLLLLPSLTSSDQRQNGAWTHRYECIPLVLFIGRRQKQQWSCIFDFSGRVYCRNIVFKPCNNNRHFTKEWLFCWWSVQLHTLYSTWPCGTWLLAHAQWRNVVK